MSGKGLKIYCDGGARGNPGPAAAAFVTIKNNKVIAKGSISLGNATNNFAEYMALINGGYGSSDPKNINSNELQGLML